MYNKIIIQNKIMDNLAGVALIINKSLSPEPIDILTNDKVDTVWGQIKINNRRVIVGSVYTKPTNDTNGVRPI